MGQQKTQQLYFNRAMIISMNIQEQPMLNAFWTNQYVVYWVSMGFHLCK